MFNSYVYSYDVANGLLREPVVYATPRNIVQALEIANRDGLDETSPFVQDVIAKYVNFDPKNLLITPWYNSREMGQDGIAAALEHDNPWLAYYRGDTSVTPPADDIAGRQATAAAEVEAFKRRLFVNERSQVVRNIRVTVNGNEYDGDETAQTRMARAVTIAHAELLNQLHLYLGSQIGNSSITAHDLLLGMYDTLAATKAALSTNWMMANNVAATVTPDELKEALHAAMLQLSANWGFNNQE